ncbi:Cytoplasmic FMR1-interacting protein 2, partial [Clarias magur]
GVWVVASARACEWMGGELFVYVHGSGRERRCRPLTYSSDSPLSKRVVNA